MDRNSEQCLPDKNKEVEYNLSPFCYIYKDGSIDRLEGIENVPTGEDRSTGVVSKDVLILPDTGVSARLFLPKIKKEGQGTKLPIVVYVHGGCFTTYTPSSSIYHNFCLSLTAEAKAIVVSVNFRRPPEHLLPTAVNDAWDAFKWVAGQAVGSEQEPWLREWGDFEKVSVMGDCSGALLAHRVAVQAGQEELPNGVKIFGETVIHPIFWGSKALKGEEEIFKDVTGWVKSYYQPLYPCQRDFEFPLVNPLSERAEPLAEFGCKRVLVCAAEKHWFRTRGWFYYWTLGTCGWDGIAEFWETEGEDHLFHLYDPDNEDAKILLKRISYFVHGQAPPPSILRAGGFF